MSGDWKPRWRNVVLERLPLSTEDAFLLSRLDGNTPVAALPALTGLAPDALGEALRRLVDLGAVEAPPADDEAPEVDGDPAGTHRTLFETELHPLPVDQREALAEAATEPRLSAFCYDPHPRVIQALLRNPNAGLAQARLVAQHHRNPVGLEAVAQKGAFAADAGVRRWLLRNPQLPASLFHRIFASARLLECFRMTISRDVPEQTRRAAREQLRRRFTQSTAEERVEGIIRSEGRILANLVGLPVDGRTTAQLCGRTYASTTLVQNIARWSAAPPALIAHLLRQDLVRRSPTLRTLLQRHPNATGSGR